MNAPRRPGLIQRLYDQILLRVTAYYAALFGVSWLIWHYLPEGWRQTIIDNQAAFRNLTRDGQQLPSLTTAPNQPAFVVDSLALPVMVAIFSAVAYCLPVAWIYMFTRQKRGYTQSVVHSLILLPVAVAGVVVLVKESLPLAFGLAGIVAAVRFRNTLEDSRDAVYVFVATALGLAAAVRIEVAALLSMLFNAVVLMLWYSDFGRLPPALEGVRAQRQLEKAMALANRTSQFVARIDQEVLAGLAPQQLAALDQRLEKRRSQLTGEGSAQREMIVRISVTDFSTARDVVDPVLEGLCKKWSFRKAEPMENGDNILEYEIRMRKGLSNESLVSALTTQGTPWVVSAQVVADDDAGGDE